MSSPPKTIRVLVADDHGLLRQGIASLVNAEPDMALVAQACTGREAMEQFRMHRPDIALMDLQMPEMGGIEAITGIRGEFPDARIVVLTTYGGDFQTLRALRAGARGYLLKGHVHTDLLETIRAVHAGKKTCPARSRCRTRRVCRGGRVDASRNRNSPAYCGRECKQGNRCPAYHCGGNSKEPYQQYPQQAGGERSHSRGDNRPQARNHRPLGRYQKAGPPKARQSIRF